MKTKMILAIGILLILSFWGCKEKITYVEIPVPADYTFRNTEPSFEAVTLDAIPYTILKYELKSGGPRYTVNIDTNGYPLKNFQMRYEYQGQVITGEPLRVLLNQNVWEGTDIRGHIPLFNPPAQNILVLTIDTVVNGSEVGYVYNYNTVVNPDYMLWRQQFADDLIACKQYYESTFLMYEERKFILPSNLPISDDYNYWWYNPDLPPWDRLIPIEDYTVLEQYIGYKWLPADPARVAYYNVFHWFAEFSVPRRAYAPWWISNRWIAR